MEAKHTPGPWIVCEHGENPLPCDFGLSIEQDGERCEGDPSIIAEVDICGDGIDLEIGRANARLIAAAPDLLAACKAGLHEWSLHEKADENAARLCDLLRAAIRKAEGGGE